MKLKADAHIHLIGICGTAMASLAGLLKSKGYRITGSDQNVYPPMSNLLEELKIPIQIGYRKENIAERPDLVIVGNVISRGNEEAEALLKTDIPYTSLPKAMGEFAIADKNSIVVAGTHGKTTVTAMMIQVADLCGVKSGYMVGGIPLETGRSFRLSDGDFFIIEGDEYDTAFFDKVPKFIYYKPKFTILTSVEFDHADIYSSMDDIMIAFQKLVTMIPVDGILVACVDHPNVRKLIADAKCKVVTYGSDKKWKPNYLMLERQIIEGRNHFCVQKDGEKVADVALRFSGEHNALNATAVFALSQELGWSIVGTLQGLADFRGVKRRQEVISTAGGVTVIEDFAHHPTAVKTTSAGIREKYVNGDSRLICLFEPRSATSRRSVFQKEYAEAFDACDIVVVPKPYDQSKIQEKDRFSTTQLIADLQKKGIDAHSMETTDEIVQFVKGQSKPGDVILVMSNGAIDGIYKKV